MTLNKLPVALGVAALAVTILGSTAVAGRLVVPKNAVGAAQLKKHSVTGVKIKNGSLTAADLAPKQLVPGAKGPAGTPGATGQKGPAGPTGNAGLHQWVNPTKITVAAKTAMSLAAYCETGETAIGGGIDTGTASVYVLKSYPVNGVMWLITVQNRTNSSIQVLPYATCVKL